MNEIPQIFSSLLLAAPGIAHGPLLALVFMAALLGLMSTGEPGDPTDIV